MDVDIQWVFGSFCSVFGTVTLPDGADGGRREHWVGFDPGLESALWCMFLEASVNCGIEEVDSYIHRHFSLHWFPLFSFQVFQKFGLVKVFEGADSYGV